VLCTLTCRAAVGTDSWETRHVAEELLRKPAIENAVLSLLSLMNDCSNLNELLLQWFSDSPTARAIDSETRRR
jgi:hypothetical protein